MNHARRFQQLTELLLEFQALWRRRPFVQLPVPWEADYPALSAAFRALTPEEILRFENHPTEIPAVRAAMPELVETIERLTASPKLCGSETARRTHDAPKRVSARKWAQIEAFTAAAGTTLPSEVTRVVDWCAGKGHLARAVNRRWGLPVTCVEINPELCETGRKETGIRGEAVDFVCLDALSDTAATVLGPDTAATALHACGELHVTLMRAAVARKVPYLAIAPCCYQRIDGMHYRPLSAAAEENPLPLSRHELRLPSLDEVKTGEPARALRRKEHAFRLGVDLLHREATGEDRYFPLGRLKPAWIKGTFESFAQIVAAQKSIPLPAHIDWARAEQNGWDRFHTASALGLARGLFRRALESRLILDRVLFLESHGYTVTVGAFCPESVTPRNLLIIAERI